MDALVSLDDIRAAAERLSSRVLRTPLVPLGDTGVLLKAESLQPSGSFKLRGAYNTLLSLGDDASRRGVVAHSSGNHAIAVAMAAARLGVPATIVMPADAPSVKRRWTSSLGAAVELVGPSSAERTSRAREIAESDGLALVEPYDSSTVIAATGTIALEILEDVGTLGAISVVDVGAVPAGGSGTAAGRAVPGRAIPGTVAGSPLEIYVPVSGGGLIAGIAAAAKQSDPFLRVIGVEPELAADATASLAARRRVTLPAEDMARTIADGLRVQCVGELPWVHIDAFVDDVVTVREDEITASMRRIAIEARLVAEPSGAVGAAAAVAAASGSDDGALRVAVLSGGNVDPGLLAGVLRGGGGS